MRLYLTYFLYTGLTIALVSCNKELPPPNIILIVTDDQGYADIGTYGVNRDVRTPHIDTLASNGILFTSCYVTSPQCVPSRAGILTGKYHQRFGFYDNTDNPLPKTEKTIGDYLGASGYVTGMVGKWHLSPDQLSHAWLAENSKQNVNPFDSDVGMYAPFDRGFDWVWWGPSKRYMANFSLKGQKLDQPIEVALPQFRIDVQTRAAQIFIEQNIDTSFFLLLSYFGPHVPLEAPQRYLQPFDHLETNRRKYGLAMISAIDQGVGLLIETLKANDKFDNTLIVVISDNGAPLQLMTPDRIIDGSLGPWWDGSLNDPWLGEKGMLAEGGIRVPFLMHWGSRIKAPQTYPHNVSSLDILPTILAAAEIEIPEGLDGVDLFDYIGKDKVPHEHLYFNFMSQSAIIESDKWKYLRAGDQYEYLFNLNNSAHEQLNLIDKHQSKAQVLRSRLASWLVTNQGHVPRQSDPQERSWYEHHLPGKR